MSSAKWRLFCLGLNELNENVIAIQTQIASNITTLAIWSTDESYDPSVVLKCVIGIVFH